MNLTTVDVFRGSAADNLPASGRDAVVDYCIIDDCDFILLVQKVTQFRGARVILPEAAYRFDFGTGLWQRDNTIFNKAAANKDKTTFPTEDVFFERLNANIENRPTTFSPRQMVN